MPQKTDRSAAANAAISLRIPEHQLEVIDRAAAATAKSRTRVVLEAAYSAAAAALADRTAFYLDDEAWAAFVAALDAPPAENPKLAALMKRTPAWER